MTGKNERDYDYPFTNTIATI